jgi:hypothetical protein
MRTWATSDVRRAVENFFTKCRELADWLDHKAGHCHNKKAERFARRTPTSESATAWRRRRTLFDLDRYAPDTDVGNTPK